MIAYAKTIVIKNMNNKQIHFLTNKVLKQILYIYIYLDISKYVWKLIIMD